MTLRGVEWTLTEASRAASMPMTAGAVRRARERALIMAKAAGASDVVAIAITDPELLREVRSSSEGPHVMASRFAEADSYDTQLVPDDVVVRAAVHVRFQATQRHGGRTGWTVRGGSRVGLDRGPSRT